MTAGAWLDKAAEHLSSLSVPESRANAEFIMAHVLGTGRGELILHFRRALTRRQGMRFWHLVCERGRRLPLAYVLGSQPFMGLEMEVTRDVLVPRPETEQVVEEAVRLLSPRVHEPLHLLEIGTGTGCIAVALSVSFPQAEVYATDISPSALRLALKNAQAHRRSRHIRFIQEDLFRSSQANRTWADLLISNPPYISSSELDGLSPEVQKEPRVALDGGPDGLRAIRGIAALAPKVLNPGGWLVLEIGAGQGPAVKALLESAGFANPLIREDFQGQDRIAVASAGGERREARSRECGAAAKW